MNRIALRNMKAEDRERYFVLNTSGKILKYHFEAGRMKPINEIKSDFERLMNIQNADLEHKTWAVALLDTDVLIGICTLVFKKAENEWHVGFRLLDSEWNKGYATEVLHALIREGRQMGIGKLFAMVNVGNVASEKVLAKHDFVLESENIHYNGWQMHKYVLDLLPIF